MIVCFDLETTGLDKYNDEIIEIAMVKFDPHTFEKKDSFSTLLKPKKGIPDLITNITNISNQDVGDAPLFSDLKNQISTFIGENPILGHNIAFDKDFLVQNGIDIRKNVMIDTFFLAKILLLNEQSFNLEMLCFSLGVSLQGAHRAENDVRATLDIFRVLVEKFHELDEEKKDLLYTIFHRSSDENIIYLKKYLFGTNYMPLGAQEFEEKILLQVGKYSPFVKKRDNFLESKTIEDIFSALGGLEERENQKKMTNLVADVLEKSKKVVIEAPTGLGKSFAYLVPSLVHAHTFGEKIFISTKTKALQDQLFSKDLAYLEKKVPFDFTYTKLKGKKNYLSLQAFFNQVSLVDMNYEEVGCFSKIMLWLYETEYGELDELTFFGAEFGILRHINADSIDYRQHKNDYKEYEFLYKAREKLNDSDVVIINHSLLFSDLKSENSFLGEMEHLILDEAHSLEDSLTDSLMRVVNSKNIHDIFVYIESILNKKEIKKIPFLREKDALISKINLVFDYVYSYIQNKTGQSEYKNILMSQDFFYQMEFEELRKKIMIDFVAIIDILSIIEEVDFSKEISILRDYLELFSVILDKESDKQYIKILQCNDQMLVTIQYTLLSPGDYLEAHLWSKLKSAILTSATLKIGNRFDYIIKMFGLKEFLFESYESDFDYKKQAKIFIPNDIGNIKNNTQKVIEFLRAFYKKTQGRTLTLLTSFSSIKSIYLALNGDLKKEGIHLYPQSILGSKSKLMNMFLRDSSHAILLGTDSFWEGIDIPGDDLKFLVIHKFPFLVPTDPIFQARSVFFSDPFLEYSLPKAIIKLKQGFGRLIRTKKDTGTVILLDDRIYSTQWGKAFFDAFPLNIEIQIISSEMIMNNL